MERSSEAGSELRSDAATLTDTAKRRLHNEVDSRKGGVTEQAKSVSSALDKAAAELNDSPDWVRSAFREGADTLQRLAETVERKDSRQLTHDFRQLARNHPGAFLAGCALAGFTAARVMKAGVDQNPARSGDGSTPPDRYDPYAQQSGAGGSTTVFAGMDDREAAAQPAYAGEI